MKSFIKKLLVVGTALAVTATICNASIRLVFDDSTNPTTATFEIDEDPVSIDLDSGQTAFWSPDNDTSGMASVNFNTLSLMNLVVFYDGGTGEISDVLVQDFLSSNNTGAGIFNGFSLTINSGTPTSQPLFFPSGGLPLLTGSANGTINPDTNIGMNTPVPEPATNALISVAMILGLTAWHRRSKKA